VQPWNSPTDTFQGGTLNGVRAQLDYLQELGVKALWLSPVLKNCQFDAHSYHGYGIQHFAAIDPRLASDPEAARLDPTLVETELRQLIDDAHARGMYVIFDIVLNHTGDVFAYDQFGSMAPWRDAGQYGIKWREADGNPRDDWAEAPPDPPTDAAVWPTELRSNDLFRRKGNAFSRSGELQEQAGDFFSLKELDSGRRVDGRFPVRDTLIRAYQYLIAKYDLDGYRIDTLKFVEPDFAHDFGNGIREYALSIGKKNFFTFGEVYDGEDKIARFIGRNTADRSDTTGVDAALDFPLFYKLPQVAKGLLPPSTLVEMFEHRKQVQRDIISSHGEASRYFVTFLDNHDQSERFYHSEAEDPARYNDQATLGLACLLTLQGIPCLYYGTEQGLSGSGDRVEAVREALWGKPGAFDRNHPFYQAIRELITLRDNQPALRYGRQYFRPVSGNGRDFGISTFSGGVLAFSRILNDTEVVVVANTSAEQGNSGEVLVDAALNAGGAQFSVLYTNRPLTRRLLQDERVLDKPAGSVVIHEVDSSVTTGPARAVPYDLLPMEVQVLGRSS
jgi:glycosidase